MKDHDILPIRREDAPVETPTETLRPRPSQASHPTLRSTPDRTTRLVADVLGTSVERTTEILRSIGGLEALAFASEADLVGASLPRLRARLVRAAFELARESVGARPQIGQRLAAACDVWTHMRARLAGLAVEEFWLIGLDVRHRVIIDQLAARGSLTGVEVHPRDVFRVLIKAGAAAVIFCHNHPSGDPSPSRQDVELTTRLRAVGEMCGITVLDHIVVAATGNVSLAEGNWRCVPASCTELSPDSFAKRRKSGA